MKNLTNEQKQYLLNSIRAIPNFPKPGVIFRDITTLLNNKEAFAFLMEHLYERYKDQNIEFVSGIESRGFIFGAALALKLGSAFVPIRKPGKLPYTTIGEKYALEYGVDEVQIHIDAFAPAKNLPPRVLLIDDLIATGGTATAAVNLLNKLNINCVEACFLINLKDLKGDEVIKKTTPIYSVLEL
ncbi:MAG: adenine phosphoribosyltransferase [Campylobacteraceae bacterium]